jgi:hypothetical protein
MWACRGAQSARRASRPVRARSASSDPVQSRDSSRPIRSTTSRTCQTCLLEAQPRRSPIRPQPPRPSACVSDSGRPFGSRPPAVARRRRPRRPDRGTSPRICPRSPRRRRRDLQDRRTAHRTHEPLGAARSVRGARVGDRRFEPAGRAPGCLGGALRPPGLEAPKDEGMDARVSGLEYRRSGPVEGCWGNREAPPTSPASTST